MKSKKEMKKQFDDMSKQFEKKKNEITQVFNSPEGKRALKLLMNLCGQNETGLIRNDEGRVLFENALVAEGSRYVWINYRKYINKEILKEVEYGGE